MARRNAVRRKPLDDEQHQEAMKVLKKFVQNKYRGSLLISQQDLLEATGTQNELLQRPQSLFTGSRNFERQSTTFSFAPQTYGDGAPPLSPKVVSLEFDEPKALEEMKYDSKKDTLLTYPVRLAKYILNNQLGKQLICLIFIAALGLIGGAVFQHLEQPNQEYEIVMEKEITVQRHRNYSHQILIHLAKNHCFNMLNHSLNTQLNEENSFCHHSLNHLLQRYDKAFRKDHGILPQWEWDYWNSVFFAGTVFTTIGYGILAPKTIAGRIAFIFYALISIPLLLVAMNVFGAPILKLFRDKYGVCKRKLARISQRLPFRKSLLNRTETESEILEEGKSPFSIEEEEEGENEVDEYEKVPWQIAIFILILFLVSCAWMFTLWEDWTFFESFYFTFTSLTTVGFGDVVPQHPRFALILFVFYTGGVFVVSTVYAYVQSQIEERYFWALQLVDQTGQEFELNRDDASPVKIDGEGVRWRGPGSAFGGLSLENELNSDNITRKSSVLFSATPGEMPIVAPPSVSALIRTMSAKRNSMARSESVISKSSYGSKWRPFSNSPSASEQLTPVENKKMLSVTDFASQFAKFSGQVGLNPSTSAPSLAPPRNLTSGGVLSVITEVSDEDTLHSRRNTRKHLSELFPIHSSTQETTEEDGETFEMIDGEQCTEDRFKNVIETATEDDTEAEPDFYISREKTIRQISARGSRRLRRVPAQDIETPNVENRSLDPEDEEEDPDEQVIGL